MNASTIAKTIVDTLDIAKLAIKEVEDLLDHLDEEDQKAAGVIPPAPEEVHLNKRGQRLLAMIREPGGAHIDRLADDLCVERESVRSLVSKVTRRVGLKAECHNGVYTLTNA